MKTKQLMMSAVAGLVLITGMSTSALADDKWLGDIGTNWQDHTQSTKSRAEVRAELEQARKDGSLYVGNDSSYPPEPTFVAGKTRVQVQAEAVQANRYGNSNFNSVYYGS